MKSEKSFFFSLNQTKEYNIKLKQQFYNFKTIPGQYSSCSDTTKTEEQQTNNILYNRLNFDIRPDMGLIITPL